MFIKYNRLAWLDWWTQQILIGVAITEYQSGMTQQRHLQIITHGEQPSTSSQDVCLYTDQKLNDRN